MDITRLTTLNALKYISNIGINPKITNVTKHRLTNTNVAATGFAMMNKMVKNTAPIEIKSDNAATS